MRYLQACLSRLLAEIMTDAAAPLGELTGLDADETRQVFAWSGGAIELDKISDFDGGIVARIEARAAGSPSSIAPGVRRQQVSYGELNARANRLARQLRDRGIGRDQLAAVALERSVELIVGVLAILKAGAAYLPLDPDYPADRLLHMLRDSGAGLVLTQAALLERLTPVIAEAATEAWTIDVENEAESAEQGNLDIALAPESLAYVMYTSGSTGMPKGVAWSTWRAGRTAWLDAGGISPRCRRDPAAANSVQFRRLGTGKSCGRWRRVHALRSPRRARIANRGFSLTRLLPTM